MIPADIAKLVKLTYLSVYNTKVSGVLPEGIRTRIQAGALSVELSSFIGTFTGRIEDLINTLPATQSAVQVGYEVKASVSGTLPASTGGLGKLTYLSFWDARALSGEYFLSYIASDITRLKPVIQSPL